MAEFNYTNYIKNNPLLQKEVKETLLTESQEVSEDAPSSKTTVSELKAEIRDECARMRMRGYTVNEIEKKLKINHRKVTQYIKELFDEKGNYIGE